MIVLRNGDTGNIIKATPIGTTFEVKVNYIESVGKPYTALCRLFRLEDGTPITAYHAPDTDVEGEFWVFLEEVIV